jgi:CheY-like chemotaxis protein
VVVADRVQLEMALVNLAVNARDSMAPGGRLEISTREMILHEPIELPLSTVEVGEYASVEVRDNGCGMSEELQMQAFEPFFTTKEAGKGTGLGLSAVLGSIRNCRGHIDLRSTPGEGTTFRIYLPIDRAGCAARHESSYVREIQGGDETVLVAEDEDEVREVIVDTLETGGYRVFCARNGAEARDTLRSRADEIDMVLSDLIMPGMGGRELGAWIREHHPRMPVVFMSGYGCGLENDDLAHDLELPKPFTPDQLLQRVREVLDAPQTARS